MTGAWRNHPLSHDSNLTYRSLDGSGNNFINDSFNAADTAFARIGTAHFADGISEPLDGPNPRTISNVVVGQGDPNTPNPVGLSAFMYAWGQFVDHDLDLSPSDGINHLDVAVPSGDPTLPDGSVIPLTRAVIDPTTGADAGHPAAAVNAITGWLDASMVYGSNQTTADSLRQSDGHMKTSDGGNLPIVNGMFAAGDARAAENPSLTALQTLFVREHNHQVDRLQEQHPGWSGDQLYQHARAIVTAEIENVTYSEFLPHLLGKDAITPYHGYDATVDPRITEEFAGAAFRFGHSLVSNETEKLDENGNVLGPTQDLKDVFFEPPAAFAADSGADGLLRHLAADPSQAMDARIVDGLRDFLSDPPAAVDLAATNIQRGRDLGLGTLNETREALGLAPYTDFDQLTDDPATVEAFRSAFGTIDKVDLWTGGLSEKHAPGAMVGETFQTVIAGQFERLRDGDRLWFENQGFDDRTLNEIKHTTLADIIERNTDTQDLQNDVFVTAARTGAGTPSEDPTAPQLVIGSASPAPVVGGPEADTLVAGPDTRTMTGGDGADAFRFHLDQGPTHATITDFQPGVDRLEFRSDGLDVGRLTVKAVDGNALIKAGDVEIELTGVRPNQIDPRDLHPVDPTAGSETRDHHGHHWWT